MTEHRALCVDDEPQILEALALHLRRTCTVVPAYSGAEALERLHRDGPFAVVLSDMRMPGMDGATLLATVRSAAPETTRMLLTGHADLNAAIAAVNEGGVFRFLTKPCPPEQLRRAIADGLELHELQIAERVLLQQTLLGSLKALGEVLELTSPQIHGRATRIRDLAVAIADYLALPDQWMIEAAATLSQLGVVSLPDHVAERYARQEPLRPEEAAMVAQVPAVTGALLSQIPRLEPVCEILARSAADDDLGDEGLPLLAGVLRLATDYDALGTGGLALEPVLAKLRRQAERYPPAALQALLVLVGNRRGQAEIKAVAVQELCEGMVLIEDVRTTAGQLLLSRGHVVTGALLARLRNIRPESIEQPLQVCVGGARRRRLDP